MKIEFNTKNQIKHYHLALDILTNTDLYTSNRFYILPYLPEKFKDRVIFIPQISTPKELEIVSNKIYKNNRKNVKDKIITLNKALISFNKTAKEVFPKYNPQEITINFKIFGTLGHTEIDNDKLYIYPRYDRKPEQILQLILNALIERYDLNILKTDEYITKKQWTYKNKRIKQLLSNEFNKHIPKSKEIQNILDTKYVGKLAKESSEYLKKLNVELKDDNIDNNQLSKTEKKILNKLKKKKDIVTFEEIAKIIWEDNYLDKYSLYAISKHIERIRYKLKKGGVEAQLIHTQRGEGYYLYN